MIYRMVSIILLVALTFAFTACANLNPDPVVRNVEKQPLSSIDQIDSFKPEVASAQALEVINNNRYSQEFFEEVFARLVDQCSNSRSPKNADIIWENFVNPLKMSGKVPPDLAVTTWNYYFSSQFVSLPSGSPVTAYCSELPEIKRNIEKEYKLKQAGFNICNQGKPDSHFVKAMYVYNTMWAACHPEE
ncbi:hypothetical protein DBT_2413 [Dissulfuribacter thermophilus]|uniref:Lipoprotein n=1 Tax=Dissulfuribacter thermophilus TaxID=1156395 RepID=A0A1B9F2P3_9BACT|nr:hypothetical protein [Dissulfuribacter thermophilus]OCC14208.1 hypothetical protein DBT_2413 [Dissulfuribacter thermophilus]